LRSIDMIEVICYCEVSMRERLVICNSCIEFGVRVVILIPLLT
jgi:homoaconitase/3-isopropylmalate dehydratase large subunit